MKQSEMVGGQAFRLLSCAEEFKMVSADSTSFVKKLANDRCFLKDMLDICLRPTFFQHQQQVTLTKDLPAIAIESLTTLYEQFIDLLAFNKIKSKQIALFGLQMQNEQINQSLQQESQQKQQFQLLSYIHLAIVENQPQQTAYSNFMRLLGPLIYQRPQEIMRFYILKTNIIDCIISRMSCRIIVEIFCKIMEAESGRQFYKEYKLKYLYQFYQKINESLCCGRFQSWLEGLLVLHRFFTEKMEECETAKYILLLDGIQKQDLRILNSLNSKIQTLNNQEFLIALKWVEELLKHDGFVMGQQNIRLSLTKINRKNSISNKFYSEQKASNHHLSQQNLTQIAEFAKRAGLRLNSVANQQNNGQHLINFYRLLYFLVRVWTHTIKQNRLKNQSLIFQNINNGFLQKTFQVALRHHHNTTLHNYIKELILQCLREKIISHDYFCQAKDSYKQLFMLSFPRSKDSHNNTSFAQQVYHIYKEILAINPNNPNLMDLEPLIVGQTQRMAKSIGGDPRKLQSDSLRNSYNAVSQSQSCEQIMEFDLHSDNNFNLITSNNPYGSVIKIHNSTSLQLCELEQYGQKMGNMNDDSD